MRLKHDGRATPSFFFGKGQQAVKKKAGYQVIGGGSKNSPGKQFWAMRQFVRYLRSIGLGQEIPFIYPVRARFFYASNIEHLQLSA
jgi:hypothetical protein